MEIRVFLVFVAISTAVIVVPGPSILLIVSNSLQLGARHGLYTVAGTSLAMLIQLGIAVAGLTSLLVLLTDWFSWFRWIGVIYLCYLGIARWRSTNLSGDLESGAGSENRTAFGAGFVVSLTNPTTMLFFVAFFPQFLNAEMPAGKQFIAMSATFWILAAIFDCGYASLAGHIGKSMQDPRWIKWRNRLSGAILIAAAIALTLARNFEVTGT